MQWDDAPAAAPESLVDESRNGRLLPGDGALPLARLAEAIRGLGYDGLVTAEILAEHVPPPRPGFGHRRDLRQLGGVAQRRAFRWLNGTSRSTRGSAGRPSTRSPMMLRWISSEPPAIR